MATDLCTTLTFRRFQGDTWVLPFQVKDANGNAVTVTGFTSVIFALFDTDEVEVLRRTLDDLDSPVTLATNVITVIVPDTMTAELEGQYLFELEIVDDSGYRQTIARGQATAVRDLIS